MLSRVPRSSRATFQREALPGARAERRRRARRRSTPCTLGGEQCKFLACVDSNLGSFDRQPHRDGRPMRRAASFVAAARARGSCSCGVHRVPRTIRQGDRLVVNITQARPGGAPTTSSPSPSRNRRRSRSTSRRVDAGRRGRHQTSTASSASPRAGRRAQRRRRPTRRAQRAAQRRQGHGRRRSLTVAAYGQARLWVEDIGYVPGRAGTTTPECSDGKDNDGDGLIDYPADPGCASRPTTTPRTAAPTRAARARRCTSPPAHRARPRIARRPRQGGATPYPVRGRSRSTPARRTTLVVHTVVIGSRRRLLRDRPRTDLSVADRVQPASSRSTSRRRRACASCDRVTYLSRHGERVLRLHRAELPLVAARVLRSRQARCVISSPSPRASARRPS